jgi:hypothetical protein
VRVHAVAQQAERFGAQLRHPGLGDTQLRRDLGHRPFVEEVPGHDGVQPVGQCGDGIVQVPDALAVQQQLLRPGVTLGQDLLGRAGVEALQREDDRALDVVGHRVQLIRRDAHRLGDLGVGRDPVQRRGELLADGVDAAGAGAYRAARPVEAA